MGGAMSFDMWLPAMLSVVETTLKPVINFIFPEGEENYIKWRAKDISGNGYVESFPVNIKVDITPLKFSKELSALENWYGTREITTKITVSDIGVGVDLGTLEARLSTTGPSELGSWMRIDGENITELDGGEYEVAFSAIYGEGADNYVMFRGTDLVGNPYSISEKFNIRVDTAPVHFDFFAPDENTYSNEREVECLISILDNGSGVDPDTVEYSVSKEGGPSGEFGSWKKPLNVVSGNPAQALVTVEFPWGRDNFIRWRANDKMGNGHITSAPYRVWVNSAPVVVISSPYSDTEFSSGEAIEFDATQTCDADGDDLSYYWSSNIRSNRSLGHGPRFTARLAPGDHTITLFVSDGTDYNISETMQLNIKDSGEITDDGEVGDILSEEESGKLWFYVMIGAAVVLLAAFAAFMFLRPKKKDKGDEFRPPADVNHQPSPYPPQFFPYPPPEGVPQMHMAQQGMPPAAQYAPPGMPHPPLAIPQQRLMLPPGPDTIHSPIPGGPQSPGLQSPAATSAAMTPSGTGNGNLLSQPSLSSGPGAPDLGLPALPPGPATAPEASSSAPLSQEDEGRPAEPDASAVLASGAENAGAAEISGGVPPSPPAVDSSVEPPSLPPPEGVPPVTTDTNMAPAPEPMETTMQCHACGIDYSVEIIGFPALVTCPDCQTQGMINSF